MAAALIVAAAVQGSAQPQRHEALDELLQRYVGEAGTVDYQRWHAEERDLRALQEYIDRMTEVDPTSLDAQERFAYWINLYNALTLDLILDHYPLESIKELGGLFSSPWKRELVEVAGEKLSLDEIEHVKLRRNHDDPRLHFAVNCASIGCPPLHERAFTASRLEEQLEEVTRRTIGDADFVDLSNCPGAYGDGVIRLSRIFDWYRDDFGGDEGIRRFLARFLPDHALILANDDCGFEFLDYDWSLNEIPSERSR